MKLIHMILQFIPSKFTQLEFIKDNGSMGRMLQFQFEVLVETNPAILRSFIIAKIPDKLSNWIKSWLSKCHGEEHQGLLPLQPYRCLSPLQMDCKVSRDHLCPLNGFFFALVKRALNLFFLLLGTGSATSISMQGRGRRWWISMNNW